MQTSPMRRQIAYAVHSNPRIDMQRLTEVQVSQCQQQCHTKDLLSSKPCRQRHESADRNRNSCNAGKRETGSSVYCACHAKGKCKLCVLRLPRKALCLCTAGCQAKGSRGPAAATVPQLLQKALCTAPATQGSVSVHGLPGKRQPQASGGHRAAALPGNSVHCACHARKLCVLRLLGKKEVRRLCALRVPGKRQPRASGGHRAAAPPGSSVHCACQVKGKCGGSVYCACQAKGSRGPAAATAPQFTQEALGTAPQCQETLCTAPGRTREARRL